MSEDQMYFQKFGKLKSDLLDSWLEMTNEDLQRECEKYGVQTTDKHIDNIQNLFEYLKVFDAECQSNPQIAKT